MGKKLLSDYETLMKVMKEKEIKDEYGYNVYKKVDDAIEAILSGYRDRIKKMEELICIFEAEGANDSYNANLSLAYVVVSFSMGILTNVVSVSEDKQFFSVMPLVIFIGALVMFQYALVQHKEEKNRVFILNLLKFRYEELKNKKELDQETEDKEADSKKDHKNGRVK